MNSNTFKSSISMNLQVLCAFILLGIYSSCRQAPSIAASVLIDGTDTLILSPEREKIYSLFRLNPKSLKEIETGVYLKVSSLSHIDINQSYEAGIPSASYRTVNVIVRQNEIKDFYSKADKLFDATQIQKREANSSIFIPIAKEANRLAEIKGADEKYLIIYSDLMENSDWLDGYRQYSLSEDKLIEKIEQQIKLKDLKGLTIIVRFIPKNTKENIRYRKMYSVFKYLFESKGAVVTQEFSTPQNLKQ